MRKIFYTVESSGNRYELDVEGSDEDQIPTDIVEEPSGRIIDVHSWRRWNSLIELSHDLNIVIKFWGSDVGD